MKEKVKAIINEIREGKGLDPVDAIENSTLLGQDLQLASFDLAELTVKIEDEYDIDIFEDGLVRTFGEIIEKLEQK